MKTCIVAGLALALLPAAAFASPVHSGPRVEALLGYDTAHLGDGDGDAVTANGITYGVQAGWDFVTGRTMIVGIEGAYQREGSKKCGEDSNEFLTARACVKADYSYYVGARVGAWVSDALLIYAKGGYAWNHAKGRVDVSAASGDFLYYLKDHETAGGFRFGGGAEYALSDHFYMKGEATYSLANKDGEHNHRVQALVGAGYRF